MQTPAEELAETGIRPIRDQVVVRQDPPRDRLESGLFVPQTANRALWDDLGVVLGVGPGVYDVRPGDRVMFQRRPDSALIPNETLGGKVAWTNVLMLREENIIAVVDDFDPWLDEPLDEETARRCENIRDEACHPWGDEH